MVSTGGSGSIPLNGNVRKPNCSKNFDALKTTESLSDRADGAWSTAESLCVVETDESFTNASIKQSASQSTTGAVWVLIRLKGVTYLSIYLCVYVRKNDDMETARLKRYELSGGHTENRLVCVIHVSERKKYLRNSPREGTTKASVSFSLRSPPPSQHLKKILQNYPEGPQVFKEALQNADDGGARVFRILVDERSSPKTFLPHLDRFTGPALVFCNDGVFDKSDWRGLQNMFESAKADMPGRIGRFGMGSRSYFHVTGVLKVSWNGTLLHWGNGLLFQSSIDADIVSVLSGSQFAFLDPDWAVTEDGGAAASISVLWETLCSPTAEKLKTNYSADIQCSAKDIPFEGDSVVGALSTLLQPLIDVAGFRSGMRYYPGTIIRLPLRMEECGGCVGRWARNSSFAPYEYTVAKCFHMINRFRLEAAHCLLFLQSVEKIELWRWRDSDESPMQLFRCSVQEQRLAGEIRPHNKGGGASNILNRYTPSDVSTRNLIRDYLEDQQNHGNDLKDALCQADTGHLPEIESVFLTEEIYFTESFPDAAQKQAFSGRGINSGKIMSQFDNGDTEKKNGRESQERSLRKAVVSNTLWLVNVRLVMHSDLLALLSSTRCPPIVGIAVPCGPSVILTAALRYDVFSEARVTGGTNDHPKYSSNSPATGAKRKNALSNVEYKRPSVHRLAIACISDGLTIEHSRRKKELYVLGEEDNGYSSLEDSDESDDDLNFGENDQRRVDTIEIDREHRKGLAFSYLPLPDVATGLPVHIHGTFQLTDNRRSIWLAHEDTDGQARRWSQWNHLLLASAIPRLYARILSRYAQWTLEVIEAICETHLAKVIDYRTCELTVRKAIREYYSRWPNPQDVTPAFRTLLREFTRSVYDQRLILRELQLPSAVARRLATSIACEHVSSNYKTMSLPFRGCDCQFLDMTDIELHVFLYSNGQNSISSGAESSDNLDALYEAVAQCQLLGHAVAYTPDHVRSLFQTYRFPKRASANAGRKSDAVNAKVASDPALKPPLDGGVDYGQPGAQRQSSRFPCDGETRASLVQDNGSKGGTPNVGALDLFFWVLLPHWSKLSSEQLNRVTHYTRLMLCFCQVLGRGPEKWILKCRPLCSTLPFIPVRFLHVVYDEETEAIPLRAPAQCFDPLLEPLKLGRFVQPDGEFRAPDVLRVLRLWGLKQTVGWREVAEEAVSKMCVVGGCHVGAGAGKDASVPASERIMGSNMESHADRDLESALSIPEHNRGRELATACLSITSHFCSAPTAHLEKRKFL